MKRAFRYAVILVALGGIAVVISRPAQPIDTANTPAAGAAAPPAPFNIAANVRVTGFDPATRRVELQSINVWSSPQRTTTKCQLSHAALATVLEREYSIPEARWYFAVRSGSCQGWLPESFLESTR